MSDDGSLEYAWEGHAGLTDQLHVSNATRKYRYSFVWSRQGKLRHIKVV